MSTASVDPTSVRIGNEVTANLGTPGLGVFGANFGAKILIPNPHRAVIDSDTPLFVDDTINSRCQPLILYDVGSERGWLVPELSVILHLIHKWAFRQKNQSLLNRLPFARSVWNGGEAAFSEINANKDLQILSNSRDGVDLDLQSLVKKMLTVVESRKEQIIEKESSSIRAPSWKSVLNGWEFNDIAAFKHISTMKTVEINEGTGGNWHLIPKYNPEIVVLFCDRLGEPIRPSSHDRVCASWSSVPEKRCYLTASMPCVLELSEMCGGGSTRPKLTPKLYLQAPSGGLMIPRCSRFGCNRLQELVKREPDRPIEIKESGAIIFGNRKNLHPTPCRNPCGLYSQSNTDISISRQYVQQSYTNKHYSDDITLSRTDDTETVHMISVQRPSRPSCLLRNLDDKTWTPAASPISTDSSEYSFRLPPRALDCNSMNEVLEKLDVVDSNSNWKSGPGLALSQTSASSNFASVPLVMHMRDETVDCTYAQRDSERQCFGIDLPFSGSSVEDTHPTPTDLLQDQDEKFRVSRPHAALRRRAGSRQLRPSQSHSI